MPEKLPFAKRSDPVTCIEAGQGQEQGQKQIKISADGLLSLAAAPTFAVMALVAAGQDSGVPGLLCSAAHGVSPFAGMGLMYGLMSAFHAPPWLRLIAAWWRDTSVESPET
jgi:hypothetical protein